MKIALSDKQRLLTRADWRWLACNGGCTRDQLQDSMAVGQLGREDRHVDRVAVKERRRALQQNDPRNENVSVCPNGRELPPDARRNADTLRARFSISVCPQTVENAVDGLGYTIKGVHQQSDKMNSDINKSKRLNYLIKLVEFQALGWVSSKRQSFVQDSRSEQGREHPRRGMHLLHWTDVLGATFGSNSADTSNEFLRQLLHKIAEDEPLESVVVVLDNAPCHKR